MANQDLVYVWGLTHTALPSSLIDGMYNPIRTGRYGDVMVQTLSGAKTVPVAEEGSYYTAINATAGTGIADTAGNVSFVTTTPTMVLFNGNATTQSSGAPGKSVYLDYLVLRATAAGTNGTTWATSQYVDTGNRWSSGGTAITPANVAIGSGNVSNAVIHFGAITATAANAQRQICAQMVRTVLKVIGDVTVFDYGGTTPVGAGMPQEGTLQLTAVIKCPPIVIPPQCSWCFYEWGASQSVAASFEFNLGYFER